MQTATELVRLDGDGQIGGVAEGVVIDEWLGVDIAGVEQDGPAREGFGEHDEVVTCAAGEGDFDGCVVISQKGRAEEFLLFGVAGFLGGGVGRGEVGVGGRGEVGFGDRGVVLRGNEGEGEQGDGVGH